MKRPIYLDYNATTPMDARVLEVMMPFLRDSFGNASSRHHALGCAAHQAVEEARRKVAASIGADPREIVFTSGATESDNLALKGPACSPAYRGKKHIVTVRSEHKAVLDCCSALEKEGFQVTYLPVDDDGLLDLGRLKDALRQETLLVSVMHSNNETGVLQPVEDIGRLCKERGILFHSDAAQSLAKAPLDVDSMQVDLLSLSAHKAYGAKGVGALYLRRRRPRVRCRALIDGGGHEGGMRSGTLNVPGIVSLGAAAELAASQLEADRERSQELRDLLQQSLLKAAPGTRLNGHPQRRLCNTLNLSFPGVEAERLIRSLPQLAVSTAAACTSAALQPSHVLGAMGRGDEEIAASVRFSLGRFTTRQEIEETCRHLQRALVEASPASSPSPRPPAST